MRPVISGSATCLLVCFSLFIAVDIGFSQVVDCPPNSTCMVSCPDNSHCVNITLCPDARLDIKKGKNPAICGSWAEEEPLVCCPHRRRGGPNHPIKLSYLSPTGCGVQPHKLMELAKNPLAPRPIFVTVPSVSLNPLFSTVDSKQSRSELKYPSNQSTNIGIAAIKEDYDDDQPTNIGIAAIKDYDDDDQPTLFGIAAKNKGRNDVQPTKIEKPTGKDDAPNSFLFAVEEERASVHWPWMVAIFDRNKRRPICGGTVVDEKHVITAAHCFARRSLHPKLYSVQIGQIVLNEESAYYAIDDIKLHEGYIPHHYYNDIAIMRMSKPLTNFRAACLPHEDDVHLGDNVTVLGWGDLSCGGQSSTSLQEVHNMTVMSNSECEEKLRTLPIALFPWGVTHSQLCAGLEEGKESCQGGSGGPLLREVHPGAGQWTLVGLVSFQCKYGELYPVVYTKLASYLEWIEKYILSPN